MRIDPELSIELHTLARSVDPVRGSGFTDKFLVAVETLYEERCQAVRKAIYSGDLSSSQKLLGEAEKLNKIREMLLIR